MPKANPYRPFTPKPDQMERVPDVSGNAVNGLGEDRFRRPSLVYWAPNPDDIPHGRMQRWFYTNDPQPALAEQRAVRQKILDAPLPPLAAEKVEQSPEAWTEALHGYVSNGKCEQVGVTPIDRDWLFEGEETPFSNILVFGVHHEYEAISTAPKPRAGGEVMRQYTRAAAVARRRPAGCAKAVGTPIRSPGRWPARSR